MPFVSATEEELKRNRWEAMRRGFFNQCPSCGKGRLFERFLKVAPRCSVCGESFHHHRADDLPPYIVISIVGHIIAWMVIIAEFSFDFPLWAHVIVWPVLTLGMCLALLQPVKGAVVGLQWALKMHGFDGKGYDFDGLAAWEKP